MDHTTRACECIINMFKRFRERGLMVELFTVGLIILRVFSAGTEPCHPQRGQGSHPPTDQGRLEGKQRWLPGTPYRIRKLERTQQTTIISLRTGYRGLRGHLKRNGITDSSLCERGQADQTPDDVLLLILSIPWPG